MSVSSFFEKNSDLSCNKKNFWFGLKKSRYVFVYVKKIVFGKEKSNLCLLNKTKSFGLKISDLFLKTRKIGFWIECKKSDMFWQ